MLTNQMCDWCRQPFEEDLSDVLCDGCEGEFHRDTCGQYVMVNRAGQNHAYFFCKDCES